MPDAGEPGQPLYARVANGIRRYLRETAARPGDALPPERVLVDVFGVSRITLRRAISQLVDENVVVRRQGVGTFVASPRVTQPLVGLHSTRDIAEAQHLAVTADIRSYSIGRPTLRQRDKLAVREHEHVIRFIRCDAVNSEVVSVTECALLPEFADVVTPEALVDRSTYELLERDVGVRPASAKQTLFADRASKLVATLLAIPRGSPVFVIDRVTLDASGRPIEWGVVSYRHDRVECSISLFRDAAQADVPAAQLIMRSHARPTT